MELEHTTSLGTMPPLEACGLLPASTNEAEAAARGNILIVDGSPAIRSNMRKVLSGDEHTVVEASTTSEAIGAISIQGIDLVLVDASAPEMGAIEFCRMLKKSGATQFLPVFVLASGDDPETEVRAIEAGADEFLVMPLRERTFRARVQANLRHKSMIDSLDNSESVLFSLAQSVEERDPDLGQHCQRLAMMAAAMGLALGLPACDILTLQRGGYLHDVGKVAIPDSVLFKPGPLTSEEWVTMKTHAERGERICGGMRSLSMVLPIIRHHHEKWDGSGYPDGLKGEEIPLLARILQLADIYDALTTSRPYKQAMSPEEALRIVREETLKGWRDPKLVDIFAGILPMFRSPETPELSRVSLHALAASLERFRKGPASHEPETNISHNKASDKTRSSAPLAL
ncbi:MAG TPA: HD domain-containing phosphohydrolase [Bryobacteraceae bacterium]|nr:HD domain-containing phosphohydrolase [Bryobacteraceae bacterium]